MNKYTLTANSTNFMNLLPQAPKKPVDDKIAKLEALLTQAQSAINLISQELSELHASKSVAPVVNFQSAVPAGAFAKTTATPVITQKSLPATPSPSHQEALGWNKDLLGFPIEVMGRRDSLYQWLADGAYTTYLDYLNRSKNEQLKFERKVEAKLILMKLRSLLTTPFVHDLMKLYYAGNHRTAVELTKSQTTAISRYSRVMHAAATEGVLAREFPGWIKNKGGLNDIASF